METQYYTLIEKQDFYEIIENKYGELAIFIDARDGAPVNPVLQFDGKKPPCLKETSACRSSLTILTKKPKARWRKLNF